MALFGSARSGGTPDIRVTLAAAAGGGTTLIVNGVPYGTVWKGETREEDSMLVNSELPDEAKAQALVGLAAILSEEGENPERIAKLIADFRKWKKET